MPIDDDIIRISVLIDIQLLMGQNLSTLNCLVNAIHLLSSPGTVVGGIVTMDNKLINRTPTSCI